MPDTLQVFQTQHPTPFLSLPATALSSTRTAPLLLEKVVSGPDFLYSPSEHIFATSSYLKLIPRNERISHSDKNTASRCFPSIRISMAHNHKWFFFFLSGLYFQLPFSLPGTIRCFLTFLFKQEKINLLLTFEAFQSQTFPSHRTATNIKETLDFPNVLDEDLKIIYLPQITLTNILTFLYSFCWADEAILNLYDPYKKIIPQPESI